MIKIKIPNTNLMVSRIIFGTGSLIKNFTKYRQLLILNKAIDCGFTHFDTAPLYGFGTTETYVGEILKKNKNLTVTTKVGLYPPFGINPSAVKSFSIRVLQKLSRRFFENLTKPVIDFTINRAKKSLENSLKNLKRDCIDIFMLHDPNNIIFFSEEWINFITNIKKDGKIRFSGLAFTDKNQQLFVNNKVAKFFDIFQLQDSISHKQADIFYKNNLPFQITYGYFAAIRDNIKNINYSNFLKEILNRNKEGSIIVSSNNLDHIVALSHATDE
jgi:aryl-alcohol dehydrogenase-like predicted oxidoreductase